jgi:hypothetical protein
VSAKSVRRARRRPRNERLKTRRRERSVMRSRKLTGRLKSANDQHDRLPNLLKSQSALHKPAWSRCLDRILSRFNQGYRRHTQQ